MLRWLRYLVLAAIAIALLVVALANRTPVVLTALPEDLALLFGVNWSVTLPLYLVLFGGVVVGVLIGFVWEWLREHRHRAAAAARARELRRLEAEVAKLPAAPKGPVDEVVALVDAPRKTG